MIRMSNRVHSIFFLATLTSMEWYACAEKATLLAERSSGFGAEAPFDIKRSAQNSLKIALAPAPTRRIQVSEVRKVRQLLESSSEHGTAEMAWVKDEAQIARYIRAEDGNLGKAADRLVATLRWRRDTRPESIRCEECITDHRSHDLRCIGNDVHGRPVLYNCFACSYARGPRGLLSHFTATIEDSMQRMPSGVDTFVWVADFEGFGLRDSIDPRFSVWLLNLFQNHYPDAVAAVVCVDAPMLFTALWAAVKPFMSEKTKKRILFIRGPEQRAEMADALFGSGSEAEWLAAHMEQNRCKAEVKASWADPHPLPPSCGQAAYRKR